MDLYKLIRSEDSTTPFVVAAESTDQWGRWMETADRRVAVDTIGEIIISTVFYGPLRPMPSCHCLSTVRVSCIKRFQRTYNPYRD